MLFKPFANQHGKYIEEAMLAFIAQSNDPQLTESMCYSIRAGGKRIRPMILLAILELLGSPINQGAYQVSAALEMIHTYSLIHDDLPAMDDDDLRRGKPTNHKIYGEALAILAGDGLLTEAFHLLAQADIADATKVQLIAKLGQAAGSQGMIAGQVKDLAAEVAPVSLEQLKLIHQYKTGALIIYAVEAAFLLAGVETETKTRLLAFSRHLGMAFQIKDDLLDVIGDQKVIGKPIGSDAEAHKSTYVSLLGVEGAQKAFGVEYQQALDCLKEAKQHLQCNKITVLEEIIMELVAKR